MADFNKRGPGCDDDCEGERGKRGKRGKRGHRGHDGERGERGEQGERGHDGHDGSDGATGPTGPASTGGTGFTGPTGPTGDGGVNVNDDGAPIAGNPHSTLNFVGGGVQAIDAGGGVANVTIPGINLVFRPGGVQAGNVYTIWADLVAAAALIQGWKTIQFDNRFAPAVIPPGVWDMTQAEWMGFFPGAAFGTAPVVTISDGASFTNLLKIGSELTVINANTVNAPIVIAPAPGVAAIFELGSGLMGDFSTINNTGGAPFFDLSQLLAGQVFGLRMQGVITGTAPAIQLGASPAAINLTIYDAARLQAGMIAGTNPASVLQVFNFGTGGQLNRQAGFAGTITYGRPALFTGLPAFPRFWIFPASVNQGPTVPSAAPFTPLTGLGMNACLRFNTTAGDIAQTLPLIRAAAPPVGSFSVTPGVLESTGLLVFIKNELGANDVVVTPDATTPDTIDGGAGPIIVPPGGSRIFMSDGVSNWSLVGGI